MIPGDLAAQILAGIVALLAILLAGGCRRGAQPAETPSPPEAPDVAPVAEAARANAAETAQADDRALEDAVNDEHPATALAHLVNADRRRRE